AAGGSVGRAARAAALAGAVRRQPTELMRVGTRGSALALAQARWVAERLQQDGEPVEIVEVVTLGDRGTAVSDKSRWVSELERALDEGRIDVAVHSAKDVPAELADGFPLIAVPPRG